MKIHILHEDAEESTTTEFWKMFIGNSSNFDVRGFGGYINLKLYVTNKENINPNDFYIVFMDYVYDNQAIVDIFEDMENKINKNNLKNVFIPKVICFEYILLTFNELKNWVKPQVINDRYNEAVEKQTKLLKIIKSGMEMPINMTSEKTVTYTLQNLCKHHRGFVYSKNYSKLGRCWTEECLFYVNCVGCKYAKDISQYMCKKCTRCKKCSLSDYGLNNQVMDRETKSSEIIHKSILYTVLIEARKYFDECKN